MPRFNPPRPPGPVTAPPPNTGRRTEPNRMWIDEMQFDPAALRRIHERLMADAAGIRTHQMPTRRYAVARGLEWYSTHTMPNDPTIMEIEVAFPSEVLRAAEVIDRWRASLESIVREVATKDLLGVSNGNPPAGPLQAHGISEHELLTILNLWNNTTPHHKANYALWREGDRRMAMRSFMPGDWCPDNPRHPAFYITHTGGATLAVMYWCKYHWARVLDDGALEQSEKQTGIWHCPTPVRVSPAQTNHAMTYERSIQQSTSTTTIGENPAPGSSEGRVPGVAGGASVMRHHAGYEPQWVGGVGAAPAAGGAGDSAGQAARNV